MKATSCLGLVAGLLCSTVATADPQYQADRAYCNSSGSQQPRALCLKEAIAAQSERGRDGSGSRGRMKHEASGREASSDSAGQGGGVKERAREGARKTRGFTHRQLQKARSFGDRHNPGGAATEPNKTPPALGK